MNDYDGVTMSVVEGSAYPGQVSVEILNATDAEIDSGNEGDFFVQAERDGSGMLWRRFRTSMPTQQRHMSTRPMCPES